MKSKILLFIPVFQCRNQITRVVRKIDPDLQKMIDEVLIIDNCSKDDTLDVAMEAIKRLDVKANIYVNHQNYSLGGSLKNAFTYAIKNKYDYIVVLHGDDQADPQDLKRLLSSNYYQQYDFNIGARFHPESILRGYSKVRTIGNKVLNTLYSLVARRKIYDMIAGINCYKVKALENQFYQSFPNNLTFDAHLLLYGISHNFKLNFFPISWSEEDQVSNAKVIKQALIILKLLARYVLNNKRFKPMPLPAITFSSELVYTNKEML